MELKSFEEMPFNPKLEKIIRSKPKLFTKKSNLKWPEQSQCPLLWAASFIYTAQDPELLRTRFCSE